MLLVTHITQCDNCKSLKTLLDEIDCSIYNLGRNRYNNQRFNTELYFSTERMNTLVQYKRIITHRIFNPKYISRIQAQDLIFQANLLLFGDMSCSKCIDCTN